MNRFRSRYGQNNQDSRSNADDQNTLMSFPHSTPGEMESVFSESSTIGDFERLGFVNRSPRFASNRTVIFASVMLSKGFFAWENQDTFDTFISNRRKLDKCLDSGKGWPLFHYVSVGFKSYFRKSTPVSKIYKYKVVDNDKVDDIKEPNKELLHQNEKRSLFKVEFCNVFRNVINSEGIVYHKFVCFQPDGIRCSVLMMNSIGRRNTDCQVYEPITDSLLNLRWIGTTGYTSVFGANDLKLVILDDQVPHLSSRASQERDNDRRDSQRSEHARSQSKMPVWAMYSRTTSILPIPRHRVLKLATFQISEVENAEQVPFTSELLTCMSMYLHELESRKERRSPLTSAPMFSMV